MPQQTTTTTGNGKQRGTRFVYYEDYTVAIRPDKEDDTIHRVTVTNGGADAISDSGSIHQMDDKFVVYSMCVRLDLGKDAVGDAEETEHDTFYEAVATIVKHLLGLLEAQRRVNSATAKTVFTFKKEKAWTGHDIIAYANGERLCILSKGRDGNLYTTHLRNEVLDRFDDQDEEFSRAFWAAAGEFEQGNLELLRSSSASRDTDRMLDARDNAKIEGENNAR